MAGYPIELVTSRGQYATRFTIDDDRPLGLQLHHVVEELQQRDIVLAGAPGDELVALWEDVPVDVSRSPAQLGISPFRPIRVRMQPRAHVQPRTLPGWRYAFQSPTALSATFFGAIAALLAWWVITSQPWGELVSVRSHQDALDGAVLGVVIGTVSNGILAAQTGRRLLRAMALGALLGLAGGLVGGLGVVAMSDVVLAGGDVSFVSARVIAWVGMSAIIGAALGLEGSQSRRRDVADGVLGGILTGLAVGGLFQLCGPGDLSHACSAALFGGGMGATRSVGPLLRAWGVLTLERPAGPTAFAWMWGEWLLVPGRAIALCGSTDGSDAPTASVICARDACRLVARGTTAAATFAVCGREAAGSVQLEDGDWIELGATRYRYRSLLRPSGDYR